MNEEVYFIGKVSYATLMCLYGFFVRAHKSGLKSARLFVLSSCKTLLLMSGEIRVQSWITDGGLVQMWQKQTVSHSPVQVGRKRPEEAKSGLGLQIYYSISAKTKERKGRGQMETS